MNNINSRKTKPELRLENMILRDKQRLAELMGGTSEMVFWAYRYFCGRQTIATCDFASKLASAWPMIEEKWRRLIRRELTREFQLDDEARASGDSYKPLGDDCDRAAWEQVRKAWENDTCTA